MASCSTAWSSSRPLSLFWPGSSSIPLCSKRWTETEVTAVFSRPHTSLGSFCFLPSLLVQLLAFGHSKPTAAASRELVRGGAAPASSSFGSAWGAAAADIPRLASLSPCEVIPREPSAE